MENIIKNYAKDSMPPQDDSRAVCLFKSSDLYLMRNMCNRLFHCGNAPLAMAAKIERVSAEGSKVVHLLLPGKTQSVFV